MGDAKGEAGVHKWGANVYTGDPVSCVQGFIMTSRVCSLSIFCLVALCLSVLLSTNAWAQSPDHWRVVWHERPATEAVVSWTTFGPGAAHKVHYDTQSHGGTLGAYASTLEASQHGLYEEPSDVEDVSTAAHYHHAPLQGLEPSTTYYFVIESDGNPTQEFHFTTAAVDDRPVKMMYGGDSRSDRLERQQMDERISAIAQADDAILGIIHGGDYVSNGFNWQQWLEWLDDHERTVTQGGRILPIVPARGNHEYDGVLFNKVFGFPGGEEHNFFSTSFNAYSTLLTLDTNAPTTGAQLDWLEGALIDSQATRWITVNYHIPAYPAVKIPGPSRLNWVPLFERYDVDMVFESDGHALKRTVPIRNDKLDETGVVYVGEGGLGVKQRTPQADRWYLKAPGMSMSGHHVQIITYGPELTYEAVLMDGSIADTYTRQAREERMFEDFEIVKAHRLGSAGFKVTTSYTIDADTVDQSAIKATPALTIDRVLLSTDKRSMTIVFEKFEPGQAYSIDIGDVRDYSGRPLTRTTVSYTHPEAAVFVEPGLNPEPEAPFHPPLATADESDEGGCSASQASQGAPLGLLFGFGLIYGVVRRRRKRKSV